MLRLLVLTLAVAALLAVSSARSEPRPDLQARAQQVLAQVDQLDRQIEQVAEAYNRAGVDLDRTRRSLRTNARELRVARSGLTRTQTALARLLVAKYESDGLDPTIAIVVGASSISDLVDRVDAAHLIARQNARVLAQVRTFRARTLAERRQLRRAQTAQRLLRESLGRRRAQIAGQLAQRRQLLGSIRAEAARQQARERFRQQLLRRQAEARLAAQRLSRSRTPGLVGVSASAPSPPPTDTGGTATDAPVPSGAPPSRHGHVVPILMRYLGTPYKWGGASPSSGFDCSGLVLYVYAQVGVSLPHNAAMQYGYGSPVDRDDLQPGDIVFFNGLGHNGVYIGGGQFIDAPKTGDVVKIENLSDPWWSAAYVGARRLP